VCGCEICEIDSRKSHIYCDFVILEEQNVAQWVKNSKIIKDFGILAPKCVENV